MYEIDSTRGYVLGYYNQGEADRRYRILTDTAGLVYARATSVRKESSKLKYFLQKLNLVEIETVDSRRGMQITGGRLLESVAQGRSAIALGVLDRVGVLVARLSQHPEPESDLFTIYQQLIHNLDTHPTQVHIVELWAQSRVLHAFGYFDISVFPDINPGIFTKALLEPADIEQLGALDKELSRYISQSIDQSML